MNRTRLPEHARWNAYERAIVPARHARSQRRGQALSEFLAGMVAVLAIMAGMIQLTSLTAAHTDCMVEARQVAAQRAGRDLGSDVDYFDNPEMILDWEMGRDGRRHTRDDTMITGDGSAFHSQILDRLPADGYNWAPIDAVGGRFAQLRDRPAAISLFGLVEGRATRNVELIPAVSRLLYRAESIDLEVSVWMTATKGLY